MQTVIIEQGEGRTLPVNLPDLLKQELAELGESLEILRHSCVNSPRSIRGDHARVSQLMKRWGTFAQCIELLKDEDAEQQDARKEMIMLPDQLFWRFMLLAYEVAQDSTICFKALERVVKGFGLSS